VLSNRTDVTRANGSISVIEIFERDLSDLSLHSIEMLPLVSSSIQKKIPLYITHLYISDLTLEGALL